MVCYARNKVGKTEFACRSKIKTLLIDFNERGYDTVADPVEFPNVDIFEAPRWEDVDPIYWYLRNGEHEYGVVVLDTVTMLASIGMKWVLKDDYDRDMNKDPMMPSRDKYLKLNEMMKDSIIKFRNLPYHIVFNVQEKTTIDEDDEGNTETLVHPELSPGSRSTLLSATNLIGRLYVAETVVKGKKVMERRMLVAPRSKFVSGGRFKQLRGIERNPTLGGFIEKIYGVEANA